MAGGDRVTLILDPNAREGPAPEYTHLAFSVSPEAFEEVSERLKGAGGELWQENPTPGPSVYFLDPDGNKLEIYASNLRNRIEADRRNPPPGMFFD